MTRAAEGNGHGPSGPCPFPFHNRSPKEAAAPEPQTATVRLPGRPRTTITAPTIVANFDATAPNPTITTDAASGVSFLRRRGRVARARGALTQIDRSGNTAVNVALVPYARKYEFNRATPPAPAAG